VEEPIDSCVKDNSWRTVHGFKEDVGGEATVVEQEVDMKKEITWVVVLLPNPHMGDPSNRCLRGSCGFFLLFV